LKKRLKRMSKLERQIAKETENFGAVVKTSRCPKDGGKVIEIERPDVICEKCSTKYVVSIESNGRSSNKAKLVEMFEAWYWL
jgi:hypothetical protein